MIYVLTLAAETTETIYEVSLSYSSFHAWHRFSYGTPPADDQMERMGQLQAYVRSCGITTKRVIGWRIEEKELRSHTKDCEARSAGRECTCGTFQHNERIYGIEEERETDAP